MISSILPSGRKQMPAERTFAWRFIVWLSLLNFVLPVTSPRCAVNWHVHRDSLGVFLFSGDGPHSWLKLIATRSYTFMIAEPSLWCKRSYLPRCHDHGTGSSALGFSWRSYSRTTATTATSVSRTSRASRSTPQCPFWNGSRSAVRSKWHRVSCWRSRRSLMPDRFGNKHGTSWRTCSYLTRDVVGVHYHRKLMQSVFSFREIIRECNYSFMLGRIISLRSYRYKLWRSCSLLFCNYSSRYLRIILMFIITTFDVCKLSILKLQY